MTVRLGAAARRDLAGIWTYSAERWNVAQADRYVRLLSADLDGLARGLLPGRSIDDVRTGYWKHTVGSHVVFFRRREAGVIEVVRILHERMDVERHL